MVKRCPKIVRLFLAVVGASLPFWSPACKDFSATDVPAGGRDGDAQSLAGFASAAGGDTQAGGGGTQAGSADASFHDGGTQAGSVDATFHDGGAASAGVPPNAFGGSNDGGMAQSAGGIDGKGGDSTRERTPDTYDGLTLWIEATEDFCTLDDQQRVSSCVDRAGGNKTAVQPNPSWRPELTDSKLGQHPALILSRTLAGAPDAATFLVVDDHPSLQFGREDFAYVVVASWHNSNLPEHSYGGYGRIVSKQATMPPYSGVALLANYPGINVGGPTTSRFAAQLDTSGDVALSSRKDLNDDAMRVYAACRTGGVVSVRVNGDVLGEIYMSPTDVSEPGAAVLIGGSTGEGLDGQIAEVVLLRGSESVEGLPALEHYLMNKYDIQPGWELR